jgi:hypothetical protein
MRMTGPTLRRPTRRAGRWVLPRALAALLCACPLAATLAVNAAPVAWASVVSSLPTDTSSPSSSDGSSLEDAASKAGETGRAVAMSLIGLGFAVAAIVLSFRRDFKEAAGIFAVGIIAVLLATPAGVNLLRDTVTSLFGSQ